MPSRMRRSLTSILSCTGVKCAWKALPPRPPMAVAARPLEAVAATLGCGGATCEQISCNLDLRQDFVPHRGRATEKSGSGELSPRCYGQPS